MEKKQISPVVVFTEISAEALITKKILISVNLVTINNIIAIQ